MKETKVATKAEKSNYRYSDFYCIMSYADFTVYISQDDSEQDGILSITYAYEAVALCS